MRLGIIILFWALTQNIFAQSPKDSVRVLKEVSVIGNFEKQDLPGNGIIMPKEKTIEFYKSDNINEVLRQQSSIHFKQYGTGLSTIAFRGTSASQTSVLWNNFNINSFTLGMTDFSLFPSQAIEEITIIPGSGSSTGGNGAFGGSVLLESPIDFNADNQIDLNWQFGSFNKISTAVIAKGAVGRWAYNTRLYGAKSENDFRILASGKKQSNAGCQRWGINQSLGYKIAHNSTLKAAVWYNDNFREIQPPIGVNRKTNDQTDKNLRSTVSYKYDDSFTAISFGTGFFKDKMKYRLDKAISSLVVERVESFADYKYHFSTQFQLKISARHNYIQARNESFTEGRALEERYNFGVQLKGNVWAFFDYAVHLRQQLVRGVEIPLSPYVGFSAILFKNNSNKLILKANSSYNYRLPTFNDRYWNDAGNPELNSETAWNKETAISTQHNAGKFKFTTSLTVFHNHVDNWIQWTPDITGQWKPRNIKEVIAKGAEAGFSLNFPIINEIKFESGFQYSYIKSTVIQSEVNENEVGKQLIYTPSKKANSRLSITWRDFSVNSFHQFTGKVYTTNNSSEKFTLEAFLLSDAGLGWQSNKWQLSGRVKNIFNKEYQLYSGYAMPGRNYQLSIQYQINFN